MQDLVLVARDEQRQTAFGPVTQIEIYAPGYPVLTWRQVWDAFSDAYPGRWAVQMFPPADRLADGKAVYHIFVLGPGVVPEGLDLRP